MNVTLCPNEHKYHVSAWNDEVAWDDDFIQEAYHPEDFIHSTTTVWDPLNDFIWDFSRERETKLIFSDTEN